MKHSENHFIRELTLAMKDKAMSKSDLARALGTQPALISRWFNNGIIPRLETQKKIADVLDIPLSRLVMSDKDTAAWPDHEAIREMQHEPFTLNETPMPYGHSQPNDGQKDIFIDQTMLEIRSRLEQLARASPDHRATIKKHIVARVDEFAELCTMRNEDNTQHHKQ